MSFELLLPGAGRTSSLSFHCLARDASCRLAKSAAEHAMCRVVWAAPQLTQRALFGAANAARASPLASCGVHCSIRISAEEMQAHADAENSRAPRLASRRATRTWCRACWAQQCITLHARALSSVVLHGAAGFGHADVLRLLLLGSALTGYEHSAQADSNGGETLRKAARSGPANVVRLLLDPAVTGNEHCAKANAIGKAALSEAAAEGHTHVVRPLLDPKVTGEEHMALKDALDRHTLLAAAVNGHAHVVRLLLAPSLTGVDHRARADTLNSWRCAELQKRAMRTGCNCCLTQRSRKRSTELVRTMTIAWLYGMMLMGVTLTHCGCCWGGWFRLWASG
eukprot:366482-Chlamydomonas_euryale.AAC.1